MSPRACLLVPLAFLAYVFLLSAQPSSAAINLTVPAYVWWNDSVNVTGDGAVGAGVNVTVDGNRVCNATVGPAGAWGCPFLAPLRVGVHNLSASVGSDSGSAILRVRPTYGFQPTGSTPRSVIEVPFAAQQPSGGIFSLIVRLTVSRGFGL